MRKEKKTEVIDNIAEELNNNPVFYITDISGLDAAMTYELRKLCFEKGVKLVVLKNTLLKKALEKNNFPEPDLYSVLEGPTAVMFCDTANTPAKLIKEFRKAKKQEKPVFKGAYAQECVFIGANMLDDLANIKSREELIGDIISLLQSPVKNVVSALQGNAGQKIAGIVKTLSERSE
ncbi:MAG: 50S ribosomal protein L10 [Prevotellaceae bacterium]|jgi:large subunit ribosomal protein L10|nr:50S ribosomal protein L10 [Prevotellaceae bacterium]